jgi:hypothetical protein
VNLQRLRIVLVVFYLAALPMFVRADGGMLQISQVQGMYRISVFTAPTPWRAGPVDVSVLVQNADTGTPITDASVRVRATRRVESRVEVEQTASTEAATNKLLHAAVFELPQPGWWDIVVSVAGKRGTAEVHLAVEAAEAAPAWPALWAWLTWPGLVVLLFAAHEVLVRRRLGAMPIRWADAIRPK